MKVGNDIAFPGAVGVILDGNADQGMDLVVILLELSSGMDLCIAGRRDGPQPVMKRDELLVILELTDLVCRKWICHGVPSF